MVSRVTDINKIPSSNLKLTSAFEYWQVWYVNKANTLGTAFCGA